METKRAINMCLKEIGSNGLDGIKIEASSIPEALSSLGFKQPGRIIHELSRQKLATFEAAEGTIHAKLTISGIHRLQRAQVSELEIKKPLIWDKRWRMVTYDVPAAHSADRQLFVRELRRLGFYMLKESTWFHAHPCFDVITTLMTYCQLQRYVTLAEITRLDGISEARLRRHFASI